MADSAGGKEVGRISIRVTPNLKGFYRELKSRLEHVEDTLQAKIQVEPDMDNFRSEVAAKTKGMTANVKLNVERSQIDRFQSLISGAMSNLPAPALPDIGGFGSGAGGKNFAAMAAKAAAIMAGVVLLAGPVVGLLTSALVSLPGLITAVAAPIGALALGMDGLKKAADRLKAPFEGLKAAMSSAVDSQFTPVFDKLAGIFPTLTAQLPKVTQGLADLAGSFANTLTSAPGMAKIESIIGNISAALSQAAPGVAAFTSGFSTLAQQFSDKLPAISGWFNDLGARFQAWVDKVAASGNLSAAFDGLGATIKTIVDGLAGIAAEGMKFFDNPENIAAFNSVLANLATGLRDIVALSNKLTGVWQALAVLTTPTSTVIKTLAAAFTGLKIEAGAAWDAISSSARAAVGVITGLVSGIGASLSGMWNGVASAASAAWGAVTSTVSTAIATVVSTVVSAGGQVLAEVSSWPGKIVGAIGNLASQLAASARAAAEAFVSNLASGLLAGIGRVAAAASSLMGSILKFIPHSPAEAGPFSGAGWLKVTGFGDTIGNQLVTGLQAQESRVAAAMTGVMDAAHGAMFDFAGPVDMATDFGRTTLDQAMGDLGIGGGALSGALKWGLDFGQQMLSKMASGATGDNYTFNVSNIDEAMAVQQNQRSKKALQYHRA